MFGHALTLTGLESLAVHVAFGLAVAAAVVAALLLIGQLAATARSRDLPRLAKGGGREQGRPASSSSVASFIAGMGCMLFAVVALQLLGGFGFAEVARAAIAGLKAE